MSVIQEALRRKAAEQGQVVPPPEGPDRRRKQTWVIWVGILASLVVVGVTRFYRDRISPHRPTKEIVPAIEEIEPEIKPEEMAEIIPEPAVEQESGGQSAERPSESATPPAWPALRVDGIVVSAASLPPFALINGIQVEEGDDVAGARVVRIEANGVWLEYANEKKFLRVGQATP